MCFNPTAARSAIAVTKDCSVASTFAHVCAETRNRSMRVEVLGGLVLRPHCATGAQGACARRAEPDLRCSLFRSASRAARAGRVQTPRGPHTVRRHDRRRGEGQVCGNVARVCLEGGFQEPVLSAAPSTTRGLWLTTRAEDALDTGALLVRTEKNGADRAPRQNSF